MINKHTNNLFRDLYGGLPLDSANEPSRASIGWVVRWDLFRVLLQNLQSFFTDTSCATQLKSIALLPYCCSANSITGLAFIAIGINVLFTLGICIMLVGTLRRIDDMCNMSLELQRVGAFALISLGGCQVETHPSTFQAEYICSIGEIDDRLEEGMVGVRAKFNLR